MGGCAEQGRTAGRNGSEAGEQTDSDEALLQAWCSGDTGAFEALFARLSPVVLGLLRARGFGAEEAEDLLQTVFLQLHRAKHSFRPEGRVRPWLYAIARNAGHALRARSRAPVLVGAARVQTVDEGAEDRLERAERRALLHDALACLPETQRQAIELHWIEGMAFRDVARAVGSTPGAVKLRAHRGCQRLRGLLAEGMCA